MFVLSAVKMPKEDPGDEYRVTGPFNAGHRSTRCFVVTRSITMTDTHQRAIACQRHVERVQWSLKDPGPLARCKRDTRQFLFKETASRVLGLRDTSLGRVLWPRRRNTGCIPNNWRLPFVSGVSIYHLNNVASQV